MPSIFKRKRKQQENTPPVEPAPKNRLVTLNVSDTKSNDYVIRKRIVFDFVLVSFRPTQKTTIDKILLKETIFWQKGHGNDECNCVRAYIKNNNILFIELCIKKGAQTGTSSELIFEYFYRDYYKWVSTDPSKYSKMFSKLVDLSYVRATPKLNVKGKLDTRFFYINKTLDAPFYIITPKPGIWVDRVVDGIVDVWEKNYKSEICTNAIVIHQNNKPTHCYLLVNEIDSPKQEVFFKKDGITWPRITKEEFVNAVRATGFDIESYMLNLILDLSNVSRYFVIETYEVETISTKIITPLNGYKVHKVIDGDYVLWSDDKSIVTNASTLLYRNKATSEVRHKILNLYVREGNRTKLMYFAKEAGVWSKIDKQKYEALFSLVDDPINTHRNVGVDYQGNRKMYMSHFTNKDGLQINTFHAPVEHSKGNMILIHGAYGHFCSDFITYAHPFCLEYDHYSPIVQLSDVVNADYDCMDTYRYVKDNLVEHKDCFEHRDLDGLDMFDTGSRFEYKRSFVEALNNMGYSVYGMDLPSHGHSEALTSTRFYTNSFNDYVDDVLQFINILKRGKFYDVNQTYDDFTWKVGPSGHHTSPPEKASDSSDSLIKYRSAESLAKHGSEESVSRGHLSNRSDKSSSADSESVDGKFYLVGYSMGSNICMRAVNEYYKRTKSTKKLVDGLVCLSGMYQLAEISNPLMQRLAAFLISVLSFFAPKSPNPLEKLFDFTTTYDTYCRFRDPMYASKKSSNKTLLMIAKATFDLPKNLSYFPEDLPTLLLNSVNDELVNIEGARKVSKLLKNSKLVELNGNVHGLPLSPYVTVVTPLLRDWLSGSL